MTAVGAGVGRLGCVVFDIDDTLYLERDYVRSGIRAAGAWVRSELGRDDFAERAWLVFEAGVRGRIFDEALSACGVRPTPELVSELVAVYRSHHPDIQMLDDAERCLERLRSRVNLAVVTDGPIDSQRAKAVALGVHTWSQLTVFTSELGDGMSKPHCRAFEMVEEATGCHGEECAYLADNPAKDFLGPRSLGWSTVRVRRPQSLHSAVPSGPDVDLDIPDLTRVPAELRLSPS